MNEFVAEIIGTMLLVLMGGGVVANVVLKGTKGKRLGVDRDHHRMGPRSFRRSGCGSSL